MSNLRQEISNRCGDLLAELDDVRPETAVTNANIVAAIDDLIVARLADAMEYLFRPGTGEAFLARETPAVTAPLEKP